MSINCDWCQTELILTEDGERFTEGTISYKNKIYHSDTCYGLYLYHLLDTLLGYVSKLECGCDCKHDIRCRKCQAIINIQMKRKEIIKYVPIS